MRALPFALLVFACASPVSPPVDTTIANEFARLAPLHRPAPVETADVALGKSLFFDVRLSGDHRTSCASCHAPEKGFSDGRAVSIGHEGRALARNAPSILNAAGKAPYFWDGRAETLEIQALVPIVNPEEMAGDLDAIERELGLGRQDVARALAAYERTLVSADSRFDRYLEGESAALDDEEVRGFRVFTGKGECTNCHNGALLTDNGFHSVGVASADVGRYAIEKSIMTEGAFKTPSLRDVSRTAPYFHDGSAATLEDVVEHYARGGDKAARFVKDIHPLSLTAEEKRALVAFLRALDGA